MYKSVEFREFSQAYFESCWCWSTRITQLEAEKEIKYIIDIN